MKKRTKILTLILLIAVLTSTLGVGASMLVKAATAEDISVWIIAGQSNAEGYARLDGEWASDKAVFDDDERFESGFTDVLYWGNNHSAIKNNKALDFVPVKLGQGQNSNSVGAEVGIASEVAKNPGKNAIIKCSVGSSYLYPSTAYTTSREYGTWTPPSYVSNYLNATNDPYFNSYKTVKLEGDTTSKQYKVVDTTVKITGDTEHLAIGHLYYTLVEETIKPAIAKLKELGYNPQIKGVWWMQGEQDTWAITGGDDTVANTQKAYTNLLTCLVNDIRNDLTSIMGYDCSTVPFVIGRIHFNVNNTANTDGTAKTKGPNYDAVVAAQDAVAANTELVNVSIVNPADCPNLAQRDHWHFRAATQRWLGEEFVKTVEKLNSTVSTPYGEIPGEYSSADDYPMIVFDKDGEFKLATNLFMKNGTSTVQSTSAIGRAKNIGSGCTIYFRNNVTVNESYDNLAQVDGDITLDLNGYKLISMADKSIFAASAKEMTISNNVVVRMPNITLKNGEIEVVNKPVISFMSNNRAAYDGSQVFTFNFNNIKFNVSGTATKIVSDFSSSTCVKTAKLDIKLTGCDFDLTGKSGITLVNANDAAGVLTTTLTLEGGNITLDNESDVTLFTPHTTLDTTFTLGKYNNNYYTLTLPATAAAPTTRYENTADGNIVFMKQRAAGNSIVYKLVNENYASFSVLTSVSFNSEFKFNVFVQAEGTTEIILDGDVLNSEALAALTTVTVGDKEYYLFEKTFLASNALGSTTVVAKVADTALSYTLDLVSYSEDALGASAEGDAVIKSALAYARAVYNYFGNKNGYAISRINALLGEGYSINPAFSEDIAEIKNGTSIRGVGINLKDTPTVKFYIKGFASDFHFTQNGSELKKTYGIDELGKYVEVALSFETAKDTISYTIDGKSESGSYNLHTYYDFISGSELHNENAALIELVESLQHYSECLAAVSAIPAE